jgi:ABC-type phosphate/phosphonate transport system substrate-binding protein
MNEFVAALPMYEWPETREETDAEWARIRAACREAGIDAPEHLVRRNAELPPVPGGIRDENGKLVAPDPASLPPDELDFHALWLHPKLLLTQTCWGPMELGLQDHVTVVGQPSYSGMEGGHRELYSSAILMRKRREPSSGLPAISPSRGEIGSFSLSASPSRLGIGGSVDEGAISPLEGEMAGRPEGGVPPPRNGAASIPLQHLRGKRFAYNGLDSMSGIIALTRDLATLGASIDIFSERIETGAHRASLVAVAEGRADVCAIDCRSWDMARRHEPRARYVEVVGWTGKRKGLPMITAKATPPAVVAALKRALSLH